MPFVRCRYASCPSAVLPLGQPPSGAGENARAPGNVATHIRTNSIRIDAYRNNESSIELPTVEVVVFIQLCPFAFIDCLAGTVELAMPSRQIRKVTLMLPLPIPEHVANPR